MSVALPTKIDFGRTPDEAPRWRCRRPGLWSCWWLGRHYATAERRTGRWHLTLFYPPGTRIKGGHGPSLESVRAEMGFDLIYPANGKRLLPITILRDILTVTTTPVPVEGGGAPSPVLQPRRMRKAVVLRSPDEVRRFFDAPERTRRARREKP